MALTDIQQAVLNSFPQPTERNLDGESWDSQIAKLLNESIVRIHTVLNELEYMGYVKKTGTTRAGSIYVKIPKLTRGISENVKNTENVTFTIDTVLISQEEHYKILQQQNKQLHGQMDKIEDNYLKAKKELEEKKKENAEKTVHIDLLMIEVDYWKERLDDAIEKNMNDLKGVS